MAADTPVPTATAPGNDEARTVGSERAVLLVNLGSPDSPSVADVRNYLKQFLMDRHVVDLPWPMRRLLSAIILRKRPAESGEAYASIWTEEGSPLKLAAARLAAALDEELDVPVRWAMRYGNPSIQSALTALADEGVRYVTFLPLYPHWAMSTTETSIVEAERVIRECDLDLMLEPFPCFFDRPDYIAALVSKAREFMADDDFLLMSYHGLPERHLKKCDPTRSHCLQREDCCQVPSPAHEYCYRHQVLRTSELVAQGLGLADDRWQVSFQSRLGSAKWIEPYTDEVLATLPERGVRRLAVMCPAFVADNLETLEEIGMQGRETFLAAGGEHFTLIPCLNYRPEWVAVLARWLSEAQRSPSEVADTTLLDDDGV